MEFRGLDRSLFMFPIELVYNRLQRLHFLLKWKSLFQTENNISQDQGWSPVI